MQQIRGDKKMLTLYRPQLIRFITFAILSIRGISAQDIWQDQRPLVLRNNLSDIQFVDQHGWMVGADLGYDTNAIYYTSDYGLSWELQSPLPYGPNLMGVCFVSEEQGWAVGATGQILHTSNGLDWVSQNSSVINDLCEVFFVDSLRGWAVGYEVILRTSDGGLTWLDTTVNAVLDDVYFIDSLRGWACGWLGKILCTSNGGNSWDAIGNITLYDLSGIYFSDSLKGWSVGSTGSCDGCIYQTQNGGYTWQAQYSIDECYLSRIFGLDSLRLWVSSSQQGKILWTTNGGNNWNIESLPVVNHLERLFFKDSDTGWVVGHYGTLMHTQDGGLSWLFWGDGPTNNLYHIDFVDTMSGWATGFPILLKTTNCGDNWQVVSSVDGPIDFMTTEFGWRVSGYRIFKTQDSGINWEHLYTYGDSLLPGQLRDVHGFDTAIAWVCGFIDPLEDKLPLLIATTDGGENWVDQSGNGPFLSGDHLEKLWFIDSLHGWVVGKHGGMGGSAFVFKTVDGGTTWAQVYLSAGESMFHSVQFLDLDNGWVGGEGQLVKTTNGGTSWDTVQGWGDDLRTFYFLDMDEGWLGKTFGEILHTTNGGGSWQSDSTPIKEHIGDIIFYDQNHGWAVGEQGLLMTYQGGAWIQEHDERLSLRDSDINPNPFRDKVTMLVRVTRNTSPSLKVYDLSGRCLKTILTGVHSPGIYIVTWDARDAKDNKIQAGIYFLVLDSGGNQSVKKIVHVR